MNEWPWFHFEVNGGRVPDPSAALEGWLVAASELPPFWVPGIRPQVTLGSVPTPRSKVRLTNVANPSADRIGAAIRRPRRGELTGGGVHFSKDHLTVALSGLSPFGDWSSGDVSAGTGELEVDEGFGIWAFEAARQLVCAVGDVWWGSSWFGPYQSAPPLMAGWPEPGQVTGYGYLMCLPPAVIDRLGGAAAVMTGPASDVAEVATASGQRCLMVMLRRAVSMVTIEVLVEWKEFLAPVLQPSTLERRQAWAESINAPEGSSAYVLPPLILPEDWQTYPG